MGFGSGFTGCLKQKFPVLPPGTEPRRPPTCTRGARPCRAPLIPLTRRSDVCCGSPPEYRYAHAATSGVVLLQGVQSGTCSSNTSKAEAGGAYYNTKDQVSALEALRQKLPDLHTPAQPSPRKETPGSARQVDDTQVQRLIAGYQSGSTVYKLADEFEIGRNTVCRILHRHQVPMRRRGLSHEQTAEAIRLHHEGWTPPQIGQRMGVDAVTVRRRLRDRGVAIRDTRGRTLRQAGDA